MFHLDIDRPLSHKVDFVAIQGDVSCTASPRTTTGSLGWIAGPIVAFFVCCCCGKAQKKSSQPRQRPQDVNNAVAAADTNQSEDRDDGAAQSAGSIQTTGLPDEDVMMNDGSAFDASKSILIIIFVLTCDLSRIH